MWCFGVCTFFLIQCSDFCYLNTCSPGISGWVGFGLVMLVLFYLILDFSPLLWIAFACNCYLALHIHMLGLGLSAVSHCWQWPCCCYFMLILLLRFPLILFQKRK